MEDSPRSSSPPPPGNPYDQGWPTASYAPPPMMPSGPAWEAGGQAGSSPTRSSGLGLASIILAGVGLGGIILLNVLSVILHVQPNIHAQQQDPTVMAIGCTVFVFLGCILLGLVLGIVGLFQKGRSLRLPIVGTVLNGLVLLGMCCLMGLSLAMLA